MRRPGFSLALVLLVLLAGVGLVGAAFTVGTNLFSTTQGTIQQEQLYSAAQAGLARGEAWILAQTAVGRFPRFRTSADLSPAGMGDSLDLGGRTIPFGNLVAHENNGSGAPGIFAFAQEGCEVLCVVYQTNYPVTPVYVPGIPPKLGSVSALVAKSDDVTLQPSNPTSAGGVGSSGAGSLAGDLPSYFLRSTASKRSFLQGETRSVILEEALEGRGVTP